MVLETIHAPVSLLSRHNHSYGFIHICHGQPRGSHSSGRSCAFSTQFSYYADPVTAKRRSVATARVKRGEVGVKRCSYLCVHVVVRTKNAPRFPSSNYVCANVDLTLGSPFANAVRTNI